MCPCTMAKKSDCIVLSPCARFDCRLTGLHLHAHQKTGDSRCSHKQRHPTDLHWQINNCFIVECVANWFMIIQFILLVACHTPDEEKRKCSAWRKIEYYEYRGERVCVSVYTTNILDISIDSFTFVAVLSHTHTHTLYCRSLLLSHSLAKTFTTTNTSTSE